MFVISALVDGFNAAQWQEWKADARKNDRRQLDADTPQVKRGRAALALVQADYQRELLRWIVRVPGLGNGNSGTWLLLHLLSLLGMFKLEYSYFLTVIFFILLSISTVYSCLINKIVNITLSFLNIYSLCTNKY